MGMTIITKYCDESFLDSIACQTGINLQDVTVVSTTEVSDNAYPFNFQQSNLSDIVSIAKTIDSDHFLLCFTHSVLSNYLVLHSLLDLDRVVIDETSIFCNKQFIEATKDENELFRIIQNTDVVVPNLISVSTGTDKYLDIYRKETYYKNRNKEEIVSFVSDLSKNVLTSYTTCDDYFIHNYTLRAFFAHFVINLLGDNINIFDSSINNFINQTIKDYDYCLHFVVELLTNKYIKDINTLININVTNLQRVKSSQIKNYAYVFYLSKDIYTKAVITAYLSLLLQNPNYPIYCCVTEEVNSDNIKLLEQYKIPTINVNSIYPNESSLEWYGADDFNNNHWYRAFGKIVIWNLTQFDKIVYLDADMLIVQNCDELFEYPDMSAAQMISIIDDKFEFVDYFNSGVMVLNPNNQTFLDLVELAETNTNSQICNDEFLLITYFNDWMSRNDNKLPITYNIATIDYNVILDKLSINSSDIKILHFSCKKPWEYDYQLFNNYNDILEWRFRGLGLCLIPYFQLYNNIDMNFKSGEQGEFSSITDFKSFLEAARSICLEFDSNKISQLNRYIQQLKDTKLKLLYEGIVRDYLLLKIKNE